MGAVFEQLPGTLDLRLVPQDECNIQISLNRDVTGYTFTSFIYRADLTGFGGGMGTIAAYGPTVTAPTIGITEQTTGTMIVGLSEAQTGILSPGNSYRWFLRWVAPGEITRTIVSGSVTAVAP